MIRDEFVVKMDKKDPGNFRRIERYLYKICVAEGIAWGALISTAYMGLLLNDMIRAFYAKFALVNIVMIMCISILVKYFVAKHRYDQMRECVWNMQIGREVNFDDEKMVQIGKSKIYLGSEWMMFRRGMDFVMFPRDAINYVSLESKKIKNRNRRIAAVDLSIQPYSKQLRILYTYDPSVNVPEILSKWVNSYNPNLVHPCPSCGAMNKITAPVCDRCGAVLMDFRTETVEELGFSHMAAYHIENFVKSTKYKKSETSLIFKIIMGILVALTIYVKICTYKG